MVDIDTFEEEISQLDYENLLILKELLVKEINRQDEDSNAEILKEYTKNHIESFRRLDQKEQDKMIEEVGFYE